MGGIVEQGVGMLYFVPVEDFGSQNPIVQMKWKGFDLGLQDDAKQLAFFNIKTFASLLHKGRGTSTDGPEVVFDPVNDFLSRLTLEEHEIIAFTFLRAHQIIQEGGFEPEEIEKVEDEIADLLNELDLQTDICRKTEEYVRTSDIPIADMSDAGTKPQHTPEMTFKEDEALTITAIAIFVKLISPIIGIFIHKYMVVLDNDYKESHARAMLTKLHNRKYHSLLIKLHNYVGVLVNGKLNKKNDATVLYNGQTSSKAIRIAVDAQIIKRLVCVSLYRANGNICKYMACCSRGSAESQLKNITSNNPAKIAADPVDQDKDEGNTSRMEVESRQSIKTADVPIFVAVTAKNLWKNVAREHELNIEDLETAKAYYRKHPVVVNPISQYILCLFYGPLLGGGQSLMLLNSNTINELSATLQMVFVSQNATYLAHALTALVAESPRLGEKDDYIFSNQWTSSVSYSECKKILPAGFGDKEWNSKLKEIASFLLQRTLVYNTAPVVWDMCEQKPQNGKAFTDLIDVMTSLMTFVKYTYLSGKLE